MPPHPTPLLMPAARQQARAHSTPARHPHRPSPVMMARHRVQRPTGQPGQPGQPQPSAIASVAAPDPVEAPATVVDRLRERGCTSKVTYASAAEAELAALTRMVSSATKPLRAYACLFCAGYHLTSSDRVSENTVEVEKPLGSINVTAALNQDIRRESHRDGRRRWQRKESVKFAQRQRRNRDSARFYREVRPQVASPEEAAAWFALHGGPAFTAAPVEAQVPPVAA